MAALTLQQEAPRGKRARVVEPEPEPQPEPQPEPEPAPVVPPMSVPMMPVTPPRPELEPEPSPEPGPEPKPVPEPDSALTGRAKRVAEAMATRDAHAAKLAGLQGRGKDGSTVTKPTGKRKVGKILKLLVAAAIVGVLALNGPHLVSSAGTWGPDLWAQLNGRSGSASACAPVAAAPSPATPRTAASKAAGRKATAKASRSKTGRKADARAKRRHHPSAATVRTPALETPVC
ncbi:hypothetical protein BH10ACT10_BH10ACT10_21850 [soil metagenome]